MNATHWQEATAIHESGHAAADSYFKFPVAFISVEHGKGVTRLTGTRTLESEAVLAKLEHTTTIERIVCLLSGAQSVQHFFSEKDAFAEQDRARALGLALSLNSGDERGARLLLNWCEHVAQRLVTGESEKIRRLAFALLEHQKLSGGQVHALLNGTNGQQQQ